MFYDIKVSNKTLLFPTYHHSMFLYCLTECKLYLKQIFKAYYWYYLIFCFLTFHICFITQITSLLLFRPITVLTFMKSYIMYPLYYLIRAIFSFHYQFSLVRRYYCSLLNQAALNWFNGSSM